MDELNVGSDHADTLSRFIHRLYDIMGKPVEDLVQIAKSGPKAALDGVRNSGICHVLQVLTTW